MSRLMVIWLALFLCFVLLKGSNGLRPHSDSHLRPESNPLPDSYSFPDSHSLPDSHPLQDSLKRSISGLISRVLNFIGLGKSTPPQSKASRDILGQLEQFLKAPLEETAEEKNKRLSNLAKEARRLSHILTSPEVFHVLNDYLRAGSIAEFKTVLDNVPGIIELTNPFSVLLGMRQQKNSRNAELGMDILRSLMEKNLELLHSAGHQNQNLTHLANTTFQWFEKAMKELSNLSEGLELQVDKKNTALETAPSREAGKETE